MFGLKQLLTQLCHKKLFKDIIPRMVNVLEQCIKDDDEDSSSQIFEVFDTLLMLVSLL